MPRQGRFFQPVSIRLRGYEFAINKIKDPKDLENNELQDGKNFISEIGFVRPRGAQAFFSTEDFLKREFRAIANFIDDDGVDNIFLVTGKEVFLVTATSKTLLHSFEVVPKEVRIERKRKDLILFSDQGNLVFEPITVAPLFKVRNFGIATPNKLVAADLEEISATSGQQGLAAGTLEYATALINKNAAGKIISHSGVIEQAQITISEGKAVRISLVRSINDNQITHFRIFRAFRETAEGAIFTSLFFIADVVYANTQFDDELRNPAINAPLANGLIGFNPISTTAVAHTAVGENVVFAVGNELRFNEPRGTFFFEIFDSASGFLPIPNGRDVIVIRSILKDHIIWTASKTYYWPQTDPNFPLEPIPEDIGCESPNGIVEFEGRLFVFTKEGGKHGLRFLDNVRYSGIDFSKPIQPIIETIVRPKDVALTRIENDIFISYSDDSTIDFNNKIIMIRFHSLEKIGYHTWENINAQFFTILSDGTIVYVDAKNNKIVNYDKGVDDLGIPLDWFIITKDFHFANYTVEADKFVLHGAQGLDKEFILQVLVDTDGVSETVILDNPKSKSLANQQHTDGANNDTEALVPQKDKRRWEEPLYADLFGDRIAFKIQKRDEIYNKKTRSPRIGEIDLELITRPER